MMKRYYNREYLLKQAYVRGRDDRAHGKSKFDIPYPDVDPHTKRILPGDMELADEWKKGWDSENEARASLIFPRRGAKMTP